VILKNLSFGQRFRICRISRHLSQGGAGSEVGVTQVTVSRWETNVQKPKSAAVLDKIKAVFPQIGDIP